MAENVSWTDRIGAQFKKLEGAIKNALVDDDPPSLMLKQVGETPAIEHLRAFNGRHRLSSILPYEAYDPDTKLFYNRDTVGFVLHALPATGITADRLRVLNQIFNMNAKPDTVIQVSMYADPNVDPILSNWEKAKQNNPDPEKDAVFRRLANNRVKKLSQAKWTSMFYDQAALVRNFNLMISYVIPVAVGKSASDLPKEDVEFLLRTREAIAGTLTSAGIHSMPMDAERLINVTSGILNPSKEPQPHIKYDDNNLIARQAVDPDTLFLPGSGVSSLIHKGKPFTVMPFHVRQFPQYWAGMHNGDLIGSFKNNILRVRCPFISTLVVHIPDQITAKGKVQQKQVRATQMAESNVAKFVPQWKDRKMDWDYTARKVDEGDKFLQAFYEIILLCPEGEERAVEQDLKSTYGSIGWEVAKSRYTPMHSLLASLPMGVCKEALRTLRTFGHFFTRLSWTCTNVAPWIAEWKGTKTPMMMFMGRRGQLMYFDPFDNDKGNYNLSCCAASGGGKSFFTQEWVFNCLASGGRAFVIDAGHSYKNLCEVLSGTYIDFGEGSPILNPFTKFFDPETLKRVEDDPDLDLHEYISDHLPMLQLLIAQMANSSEKLTPQQSTYLERGIRTAIEEKRHKATITTVRDALMAMIDPETDKIPKPAKEVAEALYPYTKDGMHGRYFEGDNNIDLDNPFVVLELDALNAKGDLQSVVLLILMMQINQVMYLSGNKKQRKLCIIDEAWRLLGRGRAGEFIEEGYRVARKHGGSFMTITQKVSDYYSSETAKAAYMNSDFAIFLRQKPEELASAENKGHIDNSDGKIDVLRSLETVQGKYSELAISSPDGLAVARFVVDDWTGKLYSTQPDEVSYIRDLQAKGVPLVEAIDQLVAEGKK